MLLLLATILLTVPAKAQNPNPGPRSATEAQFLYDEGTRAFNAAAHDPKQYDLAQKDFERLIARYPNDSRTLKAYPKLAMIYSASRHDPEKTIQTIRKYLLLKPSAVHTKEGLELKGTLAQAYLDAHQPTEARITAEAILKSSVASDSAKTSALQIKTTSLIVQKKYHEADASLDALESRAKRKFPSIRLELKTRECSAVPALKKNTEDAILDYFGKKDTCFKSALPEAVHAASEDAHAVLLLWCRAHESLIRELKAKPMDSFLKEKISKQLSETEDFAKTINENLVHCL